MAYGYDNKQISNATKIPLSTVQRRTRNILQKGIVNLRIEPNWQKLGFKRGLFHVYLKDGDVLQISNRLAKIYGIRSVSVHIGNSDIVSTFLYKESRDVLEAVTTIRHMEGVAKVGWSEEVYNVPISENSIFKRE